jgi:MFS family permease
MKGNWLRILVADPAFRHLMACRMLIGMIGLASPFYVGYASAVLRLPERTIGGFVVAQTVAGMVASIVLSLISERWGPRRVICVGSAFAAIGPAFALAVHLAGGDRLAPAYPIVYASLGVANCIWMLGFFNHMLEIAPDNMRPAYVGMGNTIMGLLTLTPMAGGWLLEKTSYTTLFGVTGAFVATGFVLTLGLKPSQQLTQDPH